MIYTALSTSPKPLHIRRTKRLFVKLSLKPNGSQVLYVIASDTRRDDALRLKTLRLKNYNLKNKKQTQNFFNVYFMYHEGTQELPFISIYLTQKI